MANARYYSSTAAVTTLQVGIGTGDASIQVASSSGFPGTFPFTLSLDYGSANEELVDVTSGGPSVFNVTRAVDGTSASSHNAGAVVRHVTSARDFTESRTHEASSTGVHGISGAFVDTTSVQTLSNKTLTAPTINNPTLGGTVTATGVTIANGTYTGSTLTSPAINTPTLTGGTFAGTIAGSPTFTGNLTLAGTPNFTGAIQSTRTLVTDVVLAAIYGGNLFDSFRLLASGKIEIGSGLGARDVFLYRSAASTLKTDGNFVAVGDVSSATMNTTTLTATTGNVTTVNSTTVDATTIKGDTITHDPTGINYHPMQVGSELVSFTSLTSTTIPITFATPFSGQPRMFTNIASGSGSTQRWDSRAINVTSSGFTLFLFQGDGSDPAQTWTNIPVHWMAVAQ